MASLSQILQTGAAGLKPKLVVTAPDGSQLWVDVAPTPGAGGSLWPEGYGADLRFGDVPAGDKVTASVGGFLAQQAPTLLQRPGPLSLAWGLWLIGLTALIVVPWIAVLFFIPRPSRA